jgi:hypothetical protein
MKLKHRITGTILLIAFATTSALPAATVPQLKSPPKSVPAPRAPVPPKAVNIPTPPKVPVVKVPAAPRIPLVPKVVNVPAAPKIPALPKLVKTPAPPKVPVSSKIPTPPKAPTVIAAKVPATAKSTPISLTRSMQQIVKAAAQDNPRTAPDVGVRTALPGFSRKDPVTSGKTRKPAQDATRATVIGVLTGKPSGKTNTLVPDLGRTKGPDLRAGDTSGSKPAFEQGFGSNMDKAALAGAAGQLGNPMTALTGGQGIGGPLGDAASNSGKGSRGIAGLGIGAISDDAAPAPAQGDDRTTGATTSATGTTTTPDGDVKGPSKETTEKAKGTFKKIWDFFFGDEDKPMTDKDVDKVVNKVVGLDRNGKEFLNPERPAPDGEGQGGEGLGRILGLSLGSLGQQISQARSGQKGSKGGGADSTPVDTQGIDSVARGGSMPVHQAEGQRLFGNPGSPGMREAGAPRSGPDYNGSAGQINPGSDGVVTTSGGRQEDPGQFMNQGTTRAPSPELPRNAGSSKNDQADGSSTASGQPKSKSGK